MLADFRRCIIGRRFTVHLFSGYCAFRILQTFVMFLSVSCQLMRPLILRCLQTERRLNHGEFIWLTINSVEHHMIWNCQLIDELHANGIISAEQKQMLQKKCATDIEKSRAILKIVTGVSSEQYKTFLTLLDENGNKHVASFMRSADPG
jgi:hypothetical protein